MLALDGNGTLQAWSYDPAARDAWTQLQPPNPPLTLTGRVDGLGPRVLRDAPGRATSTATGATTSPPAASPASARGSANRTRHRRLGALSARRPATPRSRRRGTPAAFAQLQRVRRIQGDLALFDRAIGKSAQPVRAVVDARARADGGRDERPPGRAAALHQLRRSAEPGHAAELRRLRAADQRRSSPKPARRWPATTPSPASTPPTGRAVVNELLAEIAARASRSIAFYYGAVELAEQRGAALFIAESLTLAAIARRPPDRRRGGDDDRTSTSSGCCAGLDRHRRVARRASARRARRGAPAPALWVALRRSSGWRPFGQRRRATSRWPPDRLRRSCRTRCATLEPARPRTRATPRASRSAPTAGPCTTARRRAPRARHVEAPTTSSACGAPARQAFALWTYQQLLPSMYSRYAVTGCADVDLVACGDLPDGDVRHGQEQGGRDLDRADEDQQAVLGLCRRRRHDLLRLRPEPGDAAGRHRRCRLGRDAAGMHVHARTGLHRVDLRLSARRAARQDRRRRLARLDLRHDHRRPRHRGRRHRRARQRGPGPPPPGARVCPPGAGAHPPARRATSSAHCATEAGRSCRRRCACARASVVVERTLLRARRPRRARAQALRPEAAVAHPPARARRRVQVARGRRAQRPTRAPARSDRPDAVRPAPPPDPDARHPGALRRAAATAQPREPAARARDARAAARRRRDGEDRRPRALALHAGPARASSTASGFSRARRARPVPASRWA